MLESVEEGHQLITPGHLRVGDTVTVQLWLEDEKAFIDIRLAVVTRVHRPRISVEVIRVSPNDRMRLKRIAMSIEEPAHIDHLLIRA